ncbi:tRNA (adenosine(37)-N6)-threonylcarbamoyltransferase complex transferase subunit TsaD [Candidatus Uhrbacteria bacterium]|nr:tRNA (adenosine(37)-N6)-threonylcarbamoyltransferase complex transferase subunit TsaD [Candidatus Uhrbacteria bacterium]
MRILALETSCDETSVAILETDGRFFTLHANLTASQIKDHAPYGGVVPEVAARRHVDVVYPLLEAAGVPHDGEGIDAVAVTAGPGLVPALRIGVEVAKILAHVWRKPLIPVNHVEGHLYSVCLPDPKDPEAVRQPTGDRLLFPALCLPVSGKHTELILMRGHGDYELIGMTRDDAAGEAFDKVAHLVGLPYPGGPAISAEAKKGNGAAILFPRPMLDSKDFDFSFSGLKTAVAVHLKSHPIRNASDLADVCASFQEAVVDVLATKTLRAVEALRPRTVLLTGGVSANARLREEFASRLRERHPDVPFLCPALAFTGDNAAMIAAAGFFRAQRQEFVDPLTLEADPNMRLA